MAKIVSPEFSYVMANPIHYTDKGLHDNDVMSRRLIPPDFSKSVTFSTGGGGG